MENRVRLYGKFLYHYTNWDNLFNIIKSGNIWLSNALDTNDKLELKSFINNLKNALFCEQNIDYTLHKKFFNVVDSLLNIRTLFTFSLSKNEDDASQWDRYAFHGKGVCIRFSTKGILKLINNQLIFNRVFYDYKIKENPYYKILLPYLQKKQETPTQFSSINSCAENLIIDSVIRKHKSFKFENEIRIAQLPFELKKLEHDFKSINGKIKEIKILPLINDSGINILEEVIDSIIAGPCSNQNLEILKRFLIQNGYKNLANKIMKSECPLR